MHSSWGLSQKDITDALLVVRQMQEECPAVDKHTMYLYGFPAHREGIFLCPLNIYLVGLRKLCYPGSEHQRAKPLIVSMIRKYHNHKLQTNPWHRVGEPHNNHETPARHTKQSNQLSHVCVAYGYSHEFTLNVRVLYGSVLGPLLFIFVLEALSSVLSSGAPWDDIYADHLVIITELWEEYIRTLLI